MDQTRRRSSTQQLPPEMELRNGKWKVPSAQPVPSNTRITPVVNNNNKPKKRVVLSESPQLPPPPPPPAKPPPALLLESTASPNPTPTAARWNPLKLPQYLAEKKRNPDDWDLFWEKIFVLFLFVCIVSGLVATYVAYYSRLNQHVVGLGLHFFEKERRLEVVLRGANGAAAVVLRASVGKSLRGVRSDPLPCLPDGARPGDFVCLEWKHKARLHLAASRSVPGVDCYSAAWEDLRARPGAMTDCFEDGGAAWFGAGDGVPYPMNSARLGFKPFVSGVFGQTLVRRAWLNSLGVLITVPARVPLHVSVRDNDYPEGFLCLRSEHDARYYKLPHNATAGAAAALNYTICAGESLQKMHEYLRVLSHNNRHHHDHYVATTLSSPSTTTTTTTTTTTENSGWRSSPSPSGANKSNKFLMPVPPPPPPSPVLSSSSSGLVRNAFIYRPGRRTSSFSSFDEFSNTSSTGAVRFNQTHLIHLAQQLSQSGVTHGWIILDQMWQGKIGDLQFDKKLFPNATEMAAALRALGFSLGLEVTPFIGVNSKVFRRGLKHRLLMHDRATPLPALTQFRDMSSAAVLDPTANETHRWLVHRLQVLSKDHGVSHFVLDAGQAVSLPPSGVFSVGLANPDMRVDLFVDMFKRAGVKLLAVTPAPLDLEGHCVLHRVLLNLTRPDQLRHLAHTVLSAATFQVRCLMVVVEQGDEDEEEEEEDNDDDDGVVVVDARGQLKTQQQQQQRAVLLQRWVQLVSLLPRASFWPWIGPGWNRDAVAYRNATTSSSSSPPNNIYNFGGGGGRLQMPAPMWTQFPEPELVRVSDQFALGPAAFVAPLLGLQRVRDVVVPAGIWADGVHQHPHQKVVVGPKKLSKFRPVGRQLPYFRCISRRGVGQQQQQHHHPRARSQSFMSYPGHRSAPSLDLCTAA